MIPNPWDVGSARYLQHLGFPALATTSAGFAFSQGLPDSGDDAVLARDRNLAYIASITAAVDLPVSADFMSGYGLEPEDVAESVARCVATGVAGLSIEDATGDSSSPLYDLPIAIERVRAARRGDRSIGLRRAADRESRVLPRRPSRSLPRIRPPSAGVRGGGRGCALRPGSAESRRNQSARRGGCPEAAQPARRPRHWPECRRRSRRSACDASASVERWHWRRGPASCAPHRR